MNDLMMSDLGVTSDREGEDGYLPRTPEMNVRIRLLSARVKQVLD